MKNAQKGFTLIELLVVISIISLFSSIVFASLNSARVKASNVAALQFGRVISLYIEICISGGGTPLDFNDAFLGGGNICSDTVADEHRWPVPPANWSYRYGPGYIHLVNFGEWSFWLYRANPTLYTKCSPTNCIQNASSGVAPP